MDIAFKPGDNIDLPPVVFGPVKRSIGYVQHLLIEGGKRGIVTVEQVQITMRTKVNAYKLSDNQVIIVTQGKKFELPEDVDGILSIEDGGKLRWLAHKALIDFSKEIAEKGWEAKAKEIAENWSGKFQYRSERKDGDGNVIFKGLRPPQIGGLHAIGSHWSISNQPASIIMPTGTGKTETMLAATVAYSPGRVLVVVPSKVLRDQTARKFTGLGLLRFLGNIPPEMKNPIVGVIKSRPSSKEDLVIFKECNVVISTMSALSEGSTTEYAHLIAQSVDSLIVDEAHHVAAPSWTAFREQFLGKKIIQFTATPYRRDGKLVDGKVIYEYPLHLAQTDGYFKNIVFKPVYEIDQEAADKAIAKDAIDCLRRDIAAGFDHLIMARCLSIDRAQTVLTYYEELGAEFKPIIIHSETGDVSSKLNEVYKRESRIVVCVNMLGEGFDLPQLKIAAVHDIHKSLAILLQFTGRFTRSAGLAIGNATVIANTADQNVSDALERLYSEDADWNQLLSELSSEAAKSHAELIAFLNESKVLEPEDSEDTEEISHHLLRPNLTTVVYEAQQFNAQRFFEGLSSNVSVQKVWLHAESNTLYFVTRVDPILRWSRSKKIRDRIWDLYVLHYQESRGLLYLSSSDTTSPFEKIAAAVGAGKLISGDVIFRALGRINRLIFQNVGVKKHGRRNLRFAMYTGADVAQALSLAEKAGSVKSNLSGTGWEEGEPVTIGCSYKGRVWARDPGSIPELVAWCEHVGAKLQDDTIDTTQIIANVLIPEELTALPDKTILGIDWPIELLRLAEERIIFSKGEESLPLLMSDIEIGDVNQQENSIEFHIKRLQGIWSTFKLIVGGDDGFKVTRTTPDAVNIRIGNLNVPVEEYFSNYPPMIRFVDLSELDGNLLIRPQHAQELTIPPQRFESWDWSGVDIEKESMWKEGQLRQDSIQWKTAQHFIDGDFDVVFDDDDAGEAADLVCLKEENDFIRLVLVHCKFSNSAKPGERVKDVVEVCSQAVRSAKWKWKFKDLCHHLIERDKRLANGRSSRFLEGQASDLNRFVRISRIKEIKPEIIVVQPGLSSISITPDQTMVIASAFSYLKETIGVDLDIICSD